MNPQTIHYTQYREGEKLVVLLDPSSLDTANCLRKFELSNLIGLRQKRQQVATEYGQGIHIAAADYYRRGDANAAMKLGIQHFLNADIDTEDNWRDEAHFMGTVKRYLERYAKDNYKPLKVMVEGKEDYAIEMPYLIPLVSYPEVDFLLAGVVDAWGSYNGKLCLKDIKTTALWDKNKFFEKYRRSHQMKIYSYAVSKVFGLDYYPPAIIDAVFLRNAVTTCELLRSPLIDFSESDVNDTINYVKYKAEEIYRSLTNGFIKNPSVCDGVFQCPYVNLCWGSKMEREITFSGFVQQIYDPSEFGEGLKVWDNTNRKQLQEYLMPTIS